MERQGRAGQRDKRVPDGVFDYAFLGAEGERELVAVLVMRGRCAQVLFANVVPCKGLAHEHGSQELLKCLQKLGFHDVILTCDGEPALPRLQEESQETPRNALDL